MKIMVLDGQGGGIGKAFIEKLRDCLPPDSIQIIAVGTNSLATAAMLKAGASSGVTGENAVKYNAARADIILGAVGIISANAMQGEVSAAMANAVSESNAIKILLPLNRCRLRILGVGNASLPKMITEAAETVASYVRDGLPEEI